MSSPEQSVSEKGEGLAVGPIEPHNPDDNPQKEKSPSLNSQRAATFDAHIKQEKEESASIITLGRMGVRDSWTPSSYSMLPT